MTITNYDENLETNSFFVALKSQEYDLFNSSLNKNWIIIVPRTGSFVKNKYDEYDFMNHILVPIYDDLYSNDPCYKTLGNQKLSIHGGMLVLYSKESKAYRQIAILFDETFYTEDNRSYRVMCVNEPVQSDNLDIDSKSGKEVVFTLNSVVDSKTFLWKFVGTRSTHVKVDGNISIARSEIEKLQCPTTQECVSIMKSLFISSFQIITSHKRYVDLADKTKNLSCSLKLALSIYLSHSMHDTLFAVLTDVTAERDEEVNRATRILQNLRLSKFDIRFDMCENLPKARRQLNSIRGITTPNEICECMRKVIAEMSSIRRPSIITWHLSTTVLSTNERKTLRNPSQPGLMVTSDDLLSAFVFLVIKSDVPNWYAYLEYAMNFRFASCSRDDEYLYYLTTLEATLEHVRGMMNDVGEENQIVNAPYSMSMPNYNEMSTAVGVEQNTIRQLFKLIESGQLTEVKELLLLSFSTDKPSSNLSDKETLDHDCHPLCTCNLGRPNIMNSQSISIGSGRSECLKSIRELKTFESFETSCRCNHIESTIHIDKQLFCTASFISSVDERGWSALHLAAFCDKVEIIALLLDSGAHIDALTFENETSLHLATQKGHLHVIEKLLNSGANANLRNCSGQSALHMATEYGHTSCVSAFILPGSMPLNIDINCSNNLGNTSLHIAAMWGYESIVKLLLHYGASTRIKNRKGFMPSELSATRKLIRMIKAKEEHEYRTNLTSTTITSLVIRNENQSIFTMVPNKSIKSSNWKNLVQNILRNEDQQKQQELLVVSSSSNTRSIKIERLMKAVANSDIELLKFLLKIPEEKDLQPIDLQQPLCHPLCQCRECIPIQEVIINSNSNELNVNSANIEGFQSLHIAAIHDRSTIAKLLMRYGANHNAKTKKLGLTPLHLAAIYGSVKVLSILLNKNVDPDKVDKTSNTALLYAAKKGKSEIVEILIEAGASVNLANNRGNTPLHEAVRRNHVDLIELLLKKGASVTSLNVHGRRPIDVVKNQSSYLALKRRIDDEGTETNPRPFEGGFANNYGDDKFDSSNDLSVESYVDQNLDKSIFNGSQKSVEEFGSSISSVSEVDNCLVRAIRTFSEADSILSFKGRSSSSFSSISSLE